MSCLWRQKLKQSVSSVSDKLTTLGQKHFKIIFNGPFNKKTQCNFAKTNTCEIWEITLGSFRFSLQIISNDCSVNTNKVPLLMLSSKRWVIFIRCRNFENVEWNPLLEFSKYYKSGKINSRPLLISMLCTNVFKIS